MNTNDVEGQRDDLSVRLRSRVSRRRRAPEAAGGGDRTHTPASVELAQPVISTGLELLDRSIDVDDAILHAVGLVLGWTFVRVLALPFEPRLRDRD